MFVAPENPPWGYIGAARPRLQPFLFGHTKMTMPIRNIAIIAHVDRRKTTLVPMTSTSK